MTLGRTSDNKIKIKTDGDDGLRAVSCGCCGNCLFDAFSPTPVEVAPKFKYLTYEFTMPLYDFSSFNSGLESSRVNCVGEGEYFNCLEQENTQIEERQSIQYKFTQFLNSELTYPHPYSSGCWCHIVKAQGTHELRHDDWLGTFGGDWVPVTHRAFIATIQDANWTTWADENGKLFLDEKTTDAKWVSSFCEGHLWSPVYNSDFVIVSYEPYGHFTDHCPELLYCEVWPWEHGNPVWNYSSPIDSGGFKVRERTDKNILVTYNGNNPISHEIPFTIRQTLHNTLQEIWGPNQLEMRP
jgi:hypothetical protein